jgi:hypothetical protein
MALEFKINVDDITKGFGDLKKNIENDVQNAAKALATMFYTSVSDKVQQNLHSTRKLYMDNLNPPVEIEPGIFLISLNSAAVFLENGKSAGPMTGLLNSPSAKDGANGKYIAIPFVHSNAPSTMTASAQSVSQGIRAELKKRSIAYKTLEMDEKGQPKIGILHQFTVKGNKLKDSHKSGPMEGINVVQRVGASGKIERSVVTFRTMSEKNPWISPEMKPHHFFESSLEDAIKMWNEQILPDIMKNYAGLQG